MGVIKLDTLLTIGEDELKTDSKTLTGAVNELVDEKQDKLVAGDYIVIEGNKISALGNPVLNTVEECTASTNQSDAAGASVIKELKSNFQDGVDSIYDALVAKGTTPASKSLSDVVAAISQMYDSAYNSGKTDYNPTSATLANNGAVVVKNAAGAQLYTNTFTNNYDAGKTDYNPTSATLNNAGVLSVKNAAGTQRYTTTFTNNYNAGYNSGNSAGYTNGYNAGVAQPKSGSYKLNLYFASAGASASVSPESGGANIASVSNSEVNRQKSTTFTITL